MLFPLLAAFFMKEPLRAKRYSMRRQIVILRRSARFMRSSIEMRWVVGFAALIATVAKLWFFTYNPYFELVNLPIAHYGIVFFGLNIVAWWASHYAQSIETRLGEKRCVAAMVLCMGVPILVMTLAPTQACAYLVFVQNIVRGFMRPFVGDYVNRHVNDSTIRATMNSAQSTFASATTILGLAAFGRLVEYRGLLFSLALLGITVLVLGATSYKLYPKRIR